MKLSILVALLPLLNAAAATSSVTLTVDPHSPTTAFPHNWEECVGSGHMSLALRSDYREQLQRCHAELGFKRVRMHGMMDDEMSTSLGRNVNSYVNIDSVIDFVSSIGMDLLFEIGFMPSWLASNDTTVFHYNANTSPPKDYALWTAVMQDLAKHLLARYGIDAISKWYFEVWNEPTIGFWSGVPKQETYFHLYKTTADAFNNVSTHFRLGGPVSNALKWIPDFISFCNSTGTPMSFVSSHAYAGGQPGPIFNHEDFSKRLKAAYDQVGGRVPFIVSEWGGTYSHDAPLDEPSYAPFIISAVAANANNADIFSFWAFSDVFEEAGMPTGAFDDHPNFGLLNVFGIPKPSYRAFQLLHWAGDLQLPVVHDATEGTCSKTVTSLSLKNATHVALFVSNTGPLPLPSTKWTDNVTDCSVSINIPVATALTTRIDSTHANPKGAWQAMGSPPYPSKQQLKILEAASTLVMESIGIEGSLNITVPARGVFALFAQIQPDSTIV